MAGDHDGDRVAPERGPGRAHRAGASDAGGERAVGGDRAARDAAQLGEHVELEGRAREREIDGQVEPGPLALQIGLELLAGDRGLGARAHDARAQTAGDAGEDRVLGLLGEADPADAAGALHHQEAADGGVGVAVDRVGQALRDRGGAQPLEHGVGKSLGTGHVILALRVRTAPDTRWRAASGEQPRRRAMSS